MSPRAERREFAKGLIDLAIRKALDSLGRKPRRAFARLVWTIQARSDLLRPGQYVGRIEAEGPALIVRGLLALLEHRNGWIRPVEGWRPADSGSLPLFSSLAHHLLAEYPVPPVLLSAWFRGTDWEAWGPQMWFRQVGQGRSLRSVGFPIELTKRMAHAFAKAPAHFPIEFALRWAQVRGLGGSDDLARAVASTRLGREIDEDEEAFWTSAIHLLLNAPRIEPAQVDLIVEYLRDRKFAPRPAIIGDGEDDRTEVDLPPPEPDYSVKGRSAATVLLRAEEWRAERRRAEAASTTPARRVLRWRRSGVGEYRRDGEDGTAWTIRELLDSDELAAEGRAMCHCVATYTARCVGGHSTIWSLGEEGPEGRRRLLTVEVDPATRRVVQASMKGNEDPDGSCLVALKDWAGREGLGMEVET